MTHHCSREGEPPFMRHTHVNCNKRSGSHSNQLEIHKNFLIKDLMKNSIQCIYSFTDRTDLLSNGKYFLFSYRLREQHKKICLLHWILLSIYIQNIIDSIAELNWTELQFKTLFNWIKFRLKNFFFQWIGKWNSNWFLIFF